MFLASVTVWMAVTVAQDDPGAGSEACPTAIFDQQINGATARAQDAFAHLDEAGFTAARDEVLQGIECMSEPLSTSSVSGYFRVRALDAHLRRAPEDLMAAATAMAEVDPVPPSTSITPKGHAVRNAWDTARDQGKTETRLLAVPSGGRVRVDGKDTLELPVARPTVIQFVAGDGALTWTRVLEPGVPPPSYEEAPEDFRGQYDKAIIVAKPRKPVELPVLAAVFGAGAIGTFGATFHTRNKFKSADVPSEIRSWRNNNNALVVTSSALGAVALGFGTWTVITW